LFFINEAVSLFQPFLSLKLNFVVTNSGPPVANIKYLL